MKKQMLTGVTVSLISILLLPGCSQNQAATHETSNEKKMETKASIQELPQSATIDSATFPTSEYIEVKGAFNIFLEHMKLAGFKKFIFIPYQRDKHDEVRLFCYALNIDEYRQNDKPYRIGQPFILSKDGTGEDPDTLPGADKKHGLSIGKDQMQKIITMQPAKANFLVFKPLSMSHDTEGKYISYRIFKDIKNTGYVLNPSPPGFNEVK